MRCPDCQQHYRPRPNADVDICPHCRQASKVGSRPRRIPKLEGPQLARKVRIDNAHVQKATIAVKQDGWLDSAGAWLGIRSLAHVSVLGLLIFLGGQILLVWAFLVGNFTAWSFGNLLSLVGITVAISALVMTIRNFENRLSHLAKIIGRTRAESDNLRKSRQPTARRLRN